MKVLYTALILLTSATCFAQVKPIVYFLKNNGEHVYKDSADFIRVVKEPDQGSSLYNVTEYYPKGQVKMVGKSSSADPIKLEGLSITYWPNGKKKTIGTYKFNLATGELFQFFNNGQIHTVIEYSEPDTTQKNQLIYPQAALIKVCKDSTGKDFVVDGNGHYINGGQEEENYSSISEEGDVKDGKRIGTWTGHYGHYSSFVETYKDNHLIGGTCTDSAGTYTYHQRSVLPKYKGGIAAFYQYLDRHVHYPIAENEKGIYGKVILQFTVRADGTIQNVKVLRGVTLGIDQEAMRAVKASSKGWLPGVRFGRQRDYLLNLPLQFTLAN